MMLLTIDIGNTHTVAGLFKNKELLQHWRISSNLARTEDEVGPILIFLFEKEGFKISEIQGVAISSVVPDLTPIYMLLAKRYFKVQPLIINYKTKLGLEIKYHEPSQVGADRLCNAVAGIEKYGKPLAEYFTKDMYQMMHLWMFDKGIIHAECVGGDID